LPFNAGGNIEEPMKRRKFIQGAVLSTAALKLATAAPAPVPVRPAKAPAAPAPAGVDTNVSLFQWPFRRMPLDHTAALLAKMDEHGIGQAWAGSFEGVLQRDVAGVNERLADECGRHRNRLIPFGTVNPALPDWEEDLRRCHELFRMPGIRLHPNYHGYTLKDPRFESLLALATERGLLVQLALHMEDMRTHHPLMIVPDVDATPLPEIMKRHPRARVLLLNSGKILTGALFTRLVELPGLSYDIARVEGAAAVGRLLRTAPAGRVVFGTHAPFFIYESAVIKLHESALTAAERRTLLEDNPRRLLGA